VADPASAPPPPPPRGERPCACDACDARVAPPATLCAFCAGACYPPADFAGQPVRLAMSPASRGRLHAARAVGQAAAAVARDPDAAVAAAREHAARRLVDAAAPPMERLANRALDWLWRAARGGGGGEPPRR